MPSLSSLPRLTPGSIVTVTCVLALLHFGREVLEPVALALILSLIIAPLINGMRRIGMGRLTATFGALLIAGIGVAGIGTILTYQLVAVTTELPQYRSAIHSKLEAVREMTEKPFARLEAELKAVAPANPAPAPKSNAEKKLVAGQIQPVPVEIRKPQLTTTETITRLVSMISGPVGETGLVLVLLVFILLDHESLRDRLIRLTGKGDVSRTIKALGDATEGVSRFFFSQFLVNAGFGIVVGLVLWAAGVPHAVLFGALSGVLRFVPYLGALVAGGAITLFVAAIDPGWTLALLCLAMFGAIELIAANVIEPKVYGHSSGLSPLAVMVSALFWSAMWGPVGLLLSTPLTLCMVVAGRHVSALEPVTILFADAPNVDEAHRFFHRVLAADVDAIVRDAKTFLRKFSFAKYCDHILLPGLALGANDFENGNIEKEQQNNIRATIAILAETVSQVLGGTMKKQKQRKVSMLDANVGAHLRQMRQKRLGRWQGPLDVPQRSIVLCAGFASERDDLLSELFVMALREVAVDARSISFGDNRETPGEDTANLVSTIFITYPLASMMDNWIPVVQELRTNLPHAIIVTIRLFSEENQADQSVIKKHVDMVLRSFEEGLAFVAPNRANRS
ncbi:AI-2E family transporter [Undibacterium sp. CY18W]|uniref:AI-2E family transporter n=1 Tax=Undibacterium hunanense TaxID=2762292 RepID=A0ABR6ZMJ8_9BURK|nr:AI-2E family transporter [Undibacterium hunanense]MBC3917097.1 AI-2E family transporter [Undibacterium hunanense]